MNIYNICGKAWQIGSWCILIGLIICNVILLRTVSKQRTELDRLKPPPIVANDYVAPLMGRTMDDRVVEVRPAQGDRKTIVLYFRTGCPYCRTQFAYWRQLIGRLDSRQYQLICLVPDSEDRHKVREYMKSMEVGHIEPAFISREVIRKNKLLVTPITLIVSELGTVERAWSGLWNNDDLKVAGRFLHMILAPAR